MSSQGSAVATWCSAATLGGTTERAELISQQRASSIAAASTAQGPDRSSSLCPAAAWPLLVLECGGATQNCQYFTAERGELGSM